MIHAVWMIECVWTLATTAAPSEHATSLIVLICFVIEGPLTNLFLAGVVQNASPNFP
jgi:hypothetical protein